MHRAKNAIYHVNPLCQKWEEENHKKHMERRIRSAKSSLPTSAGAKRANSARGAQGRPKQAPAIAGAGQALGSSIGEQIQEMMPGVDIRVLDELIAQRLQQVLGQPMIQRIQQHVLLQRQQHHMAAQGHTVHSQCTHQTTSPGVSKTAKTPTKSKTRSGCAKPPQPRARPAWNDDWTAPGPPLPLCAGAFPMPKAKNSPVNKGSPSYQPLPHSPQPGPHPGSTSKGIRVQLLPTHESDSQSRPCSSTRYANNTLLTTSHIAAIAALNPCGPAKPPAALSSKPPRPSQSSAYEDSTPSEAAGHHPPSIFAPTTPGAEGGPGTSLRPDSSRVVHPDNMDIGLMSLSRLSSAQRSPCLHHNRHRDHSPSLSSRPSKPSTTLSTVAVQGSEDDLNSSGHDVNVGSWSRAAVRTQLVSTYEGSDYDDDAFEVYDDDGSSSEGEVGATAAPAAGHSQAAAHDQALLQRSVSELNALLQLKIKAVLRTSRAVSVRASSQVRSSRQEQQHAQHMGLNSTLGVMGGDAQFGESSDLLGEQPLCSADLAYLDLHQTDDQDDGVQFYHIDLPQWALSKEGAWYEATTVEPGLPLGTVTDQEAAGTQLAHDHAQDADSPCQLQGQTQAAAGVGTLHHHVLQEDEVLIGTCPDFQGQTSDGQKAVTAASQVATTCVSSSQQLQSTTGGSGPWAGPDDPRTWISLPDLLAGKAISRTVSGRQPGASDHQQQAVQPDMSSLPTGGTLAGQVLALWDSLRQLNDLMSGPRGAELSPGGDKFRGHGGFQPPATSPCSTPTKCAPTDLEELKATAALCADKSGQGQGQEDVQGTCEAEEQQVWIARLMHTISCSLGDDDLMQGTFAVH